MNKLSLILLVCLLTNCPAAWADGVQIKKIENQNDYTLKVNWEREDNDSLAIVFCKREYRGAKLVSASVDFRFVSSADWSLLEKNGDDSIMLNSNIVKNDFALGKAVTDRFVRLLGKDHVFKTTEWLLTSRNDLSINDDDVLRSKLNKAASALADIKFTDNDAYIGIVADYKSGELDDAVNNKTEIIIGFFDLN